MQNQYKVSDKCAGVVASPKLEAEGAQAHLIACSERYAAAFPMEDGYRRPETLNEEVLGSDLWTAARVRGPQHLLPGVCRNAHTTPV